MLTLFTEGFPLYSTLPDPDDLSDKDSLIVKEAFPEPDLLISAASEIKLIAFRFPDPDWLTLISPTEPPAMLRSPEPLMVRSSSSAKRLLKVAFQEPLNTITSSTDLRTDMHYRFPDTLLCIPSRWIKVTVTLRHIIR